MRIGIDLGGTKIEGIALADNGEILYRKRVDTPQDQYRNTLQAIAGLIQDIKEHQQQDAPVGIGIPGSISPTTGTFRNANSTCLIGRFVKEDLETLLKQEIRVANDADCFTLSEATDGAGQDGNIVFGVIIGTGTGGGIVVNGHLLDGPNRIAGEWGHNPLPWITPEEYPGPSCYCGKNGCIETFLSGPGFSADFQRHYQQQLSAVDIMQRYQQGDQQAMHNLERYIDRLARSLASIINVIDPDIIVLGGGMSKISQLYEKVPEVWHRYVFSDAVTTQLKAPVHGDSSGVRGAAWLWPLTD